MIFIPKAGKNGWTSTKDFRPISLTSFVVKTVERLMDRYIRDKILMEKLLHKDQHVYESGGSTETASEVIRRAMIAQGVSIAVVDWINYCIYSPTRDVTPLDMLITF